MRPTYAEAFVSSVLNDECIANNIIHPKVEKSSEKRRKLTDHLYNKIGQAATWITRAIFSHRFAFGMPFP